MLAMDKKSSSEGQFQAQEIKFRNSAKRQIKYNVTKC